MGYSFAAGTTDGPGAFDFTQGATSSNDFWNLVSSALVEPSPEVKSCHEPKPVLISTGEVRLLLNQLIISIWGPSDPSNKQRII